MTENAVIFDLDGVIVSTDDCHYRAWKRLADEEGIYFDRRLTTGYGGQPDGILVNRFRAANRPYTTEERQALAERKNGYYRELINELTPEHISWCDAAHGATEGARDQDRDRFFQ